MSSKSPKRKTERSGGGSTRRAFLKGSVVSLLPQLVPARARALLSGRPDAYDFHAIREVIQAAVGSHKATGIAVAVAHHGRIIWEEGFGWANHQAGTRVTEHTPFCLASVTKPFTTTALMTLVASGKISLDDSANKYLGKSVLQGNAEGATIRRLGAHAAGLPSMFEMFPSNQCAPPPSPAALLKNYGTLAYLPKQVYEYSNIGFTALGSIAANVSGLEFDEFLTRRVLTPLGLQDSFFDSDKTRLPSDAVLYDELERPIPQYFTATPPSGELYASAHDLARFALFNLKNHLHDQAPILNDQLIDELHRPVFLGPSGAATAFGWFSGATKTGLPVIFKDGGQPGVSTIMYVVPGENLACVALANRSDNGDFVQSLVDQMANTILENWTPPNFSVGSPTVDFPGGPIYTGKWIGKLHGGGTESRVSLEITPQGSATVALGDKGPERITDLGLEGTALVGKSVGMIKSPDTIRNRATSLSLKVQPRENKLAGRILTTAASPGELAILPYVVELGRSK